MLQPSPDSVGPLYPRTRYASAPAPPRLADAGGDHLDAGGVVAAAGDDGEEYWRAHRHLGFTWEELVEISLMGFDSAFMHRPEKLAMIARVREEIAEAPQPA